MRNTARAKGHLTWTHMKLILANLNNVLAFKHVPKLVFVRVNVKRRVERVYFFDDGESPASRIGRGPDDEVRTAESEAFTALCTDLEAANVFHSSNGIGFAHPSQQRARHSTSSVWSGGRGVCERGCARGGTRTYATGVSSSVI